MSRGNTIVAAFGVAVAALVAGVWYPVPVYVACGAVAAVLLTVGLVSAWRRNRRPPAAFVVDEHDRSFRTARHAHGLLIGLACLPIMVFFLLVTRESVWPGLSGAGLFAAVLGAQWRALRHGHGLTLHPGGIEAARSAGTLLIPWEALAADQPGRGANWWEIHLVYVRPDLVTTTGRVYDRSAVVFEGADPDFVRSAIVTYATEPGRRHLIGSAAEHERLQAAMPGPPRGTTEIVEPATTSTSVRRLVAGLALFAAAVAVAGAPGWWEWLSGPLGWFGARQLHLTVAGWRAARQRHDVRHV